MGVSTVNVTPSVIFGPFIRQLWFSSNRNLALPFLSGVWLVGRVIPVSVAVNLSCSDMQGSLVNGEPSFTSTTKPEENFALNFVLGLADCMEYQTYIGFHRLAIVLL